MTKRIVFVLAALAAATVVVAQAVREVPMTPEKRAQLLERAGGYIDPPSNGKSVLILDLRGDGKEDLARVFLDHQKSMFGYPVTVKRETMPEGSVSAYRLAKDAQSTGFPVVIVLVEDGDLPGLAVFPEEALALVNAAKYRCDDQERFSRRMTRELWRAFGFALGAYGDQPQGDVLQAVFSNERLDKVRSPVLAPARSGAVTRSAQTLGLRSMQPTTYEVACQQGWAPPPTNEVQRAVWARLNNEKEQGPAVQRPITRRRRAK